MAFVSLANVLVLLQLSLLLCGSITVYGDAHSPPAEAPHPPHHHHHHPPTPPPSHPPTPPPSHPPTPPPSHPPTPPPSHPPTPPPSHPPTPPPSHPPMPPPSHPPTPPPSHPPTPPPSHPPTPPPSHPPTPPPSHPPVTPPAHPPVKPPSYPSPRKKVAVQGVVYCKSCKYRGIDTLLKASPLAGAVVKLQCNNTKYPLVEQTKTDKNGYFFFMPSKLTTSGSHKCKVFLVSSPLARCSVPTNLHGGTVGAILIPSPKPPVATSPFKLFTVGPFAFEPHKKLPCHY